MPGLPSRDAGWIVQQMDRKLKAIPEVVSVFGKVGRADSATDSAPMSMIETTARRKRRPDNWLDTTTEETEQKSDLPFTPREGWLSVLALLVMMFVVGLAIDDEGQPLADDAVIVDAEDPDLANGRRGAVHVRLVARPA